MCGIFGIISSKKLKILVNHSQQRGRDSSGLISFDGLDYLIQRADFDIKKLVSNSKINFSNIIFGHSRLITNGLSDNQPVVRDNIAVIHNGIIVNENEVWDSLTVQRKFVIDSEIIVAIAEEHLNNNKNISDLPSKILSKCKGIVSCALIFPKLGKLLLFSNNGSLYIGDTGSEKYFASERYGLEKIGVLGH